MREIATLFKRMEALISVLSPSDNVHLALCSSRLLKKCPISKLYFKVLPKMDTRKIRKMLTHPGVPLNLVPLNLTYLQLDLTNTPAFVNFLDFSHLLHLELKSYDFDLVLPGHLRTFIGRNIQKNLTLPPGLTRLIFKGYSTPDNIIGLEKHSNLTLLHFGWMDDYKFEMPPNLTELHIKDFSHTVLPETLRILSTWHLPSCLPDALEDIHAQYLSSNVKLPIGLRKLSLLTFEGIAPIQVSQCSALTQISVRSNLKTSMRNSLEFVDQFIPQVTDLGFNSITPSEMLTSLKFVNLQRLTIDTKHNMLDLTIEIGHLVTLTSLKICRCVKLRQNGAIELPPLLRKLVFIRNKCYCRVVVDNFQWICTLPGSVKVLNVEAWHSSAFSISVSHEHLARLDIVGDREQNGRIATTWGQFVLLD